MTAEDGRATKQFGMSKEDVESAEMATAVWSDLLSFTHSKMERLDADSYDIEFEVTIRYDE